MRAKQARFVQEYLVDMNATRAAVRAGYSPKTARSIGAENLTKPDVQIAIAAAREEQRVRLNLKSDDVVRVLSGIIHADRNELAELRRFCCRYCHSPNGDPQETPGEQRQRRKAHEREVAIILAKMPAGVDLSAIRAALDFDAQGGDGYDQRKPINPDCRECFGLGIERVIFHDTTQLGPAARLAFEGVKQTRDGLEIRMFSRADAVAALAKRFGIDGKGERPRTQIASDYPFNTRPIDPVEAARAYARLMDAVDD